MNSLERLILKAHNNGHRLMLQFDPDELGEQWAVKYYPDSEDNAHFYAYNCDLDNACRQLLDELREARV